MAETGLYSWNGLITLIILLGSGYAAMWLLSVILKNFGKRDLFKRKLLNVLRRAMLIYATLGVVIILLGFISINYITHGLLLAIIGFLCFGYIRDIISGLFLKITNSIKEGDSIEVDDLQGEVERLLIFGLNIGHGNGESFMNYSSLYNQGFTVKSDKHSLFRRTVRIKSSKSPDQMMGLLFENPMFSFTDPPNIQHGEHPDQYLLQYTLEHGSSSEDLSAFLQHHQIEMIFDAKK